MRKQKKGFQRLLKVLQEEGSKAAEVYLEQVRYRK